MSIEVKYKIKDVADDFAILVGGDEALQVAVTGRRRPPAGVEHGLQGLPGHRLVRHRPHHPATADGGEHGRPGLVAVHGTS